VVSLQVMLKTMDPTSQKRGEYLAGSVVKAEENRTPWQATIKKRRDSKVERGGKEEVYTGEKRTGGLPISREPNNEEKSRQRAMVIDKTNCNTEKRGRG